MIVYCFNYYAVNIMGNVQNNSKTSLVRRYVLTILRMIVLAAAVFLILIITRDIFENISFLADPRYLKFQFWICMIFMFDIVMECILGVRTWKRLLMEIAFFFLCIPFINIIDYFGSHVSGEILFLLRLLPMLRATYVIVVVTSTIRTNRVTNLFRAYITLFIVTVYFSSLMFYVEEHSVNHDVDTYWSALWWSIMTLTTAGCYITEVTTVGKILSVVLSGGGLILFPVFTVYVANAVSGTSGSHSSDDKKQSGSDEQSGNSANFANDNSEATASQTAK